MIYLSVDPGETTGICVAKYSVGWPHSWIEALISCPWEGAKERITTYVSLFPDTFLIVERSPKWKVDPTQSERVNWTIGVGKELYEIMSTPSICILSPGDWKPIAKARHWKHPAAKDQHQIDAFNLFRYYIWRKYRHEIPYLEVEGDK